ncbi:unnamed protein product (macronuclear) [Paramecium tetraurelia]|uniref:Uncharacterized protein n=1 Tax=Paramecium tetraurelia TaxID=5888 RepID=A0D0J5_PARTE|nr:uncharacterized protein GSPATT00012114001 [Paramecium tetraurelia]CAK76562.1 unnamed protein product [Paramecium tetraurelia]|eukprot:XP_001443959.1 hypothetical protein (macronuclear) [Paramecium tetraurelia strain d4-2]
MIRLRNIIGSALHIQTSLFRFSTQAPQQPNDQFNKKVLFAGKSADKPKKQHQRSEQKHSQQQKKEGNENQQHEQSAPYRQQERHFDRQQFHKQKVDEPKFYRGDRDRRSPDQQQQQQQEQQETPKKTGILFGNKSKDAKLVAAKFQTKRVFNQILKKKIENEKQNEKIFIDQLNQAQNIHNIHERNSKLIDLYASQSKWDKVKDIFKSEKQFNSGVYSAYINQTASHSVDLADYEQLKALIKKVGDRAHKLQPEAFQSLYYMIFNLDLFPNEKAKELEHLINIVTTHHLTPQFDLTYFQTLLEEQSIENEKASHLAVIKVFNQYFERYVQQNKGKSTVDLPNLNIAFAIAVKSTILYNTNDAQNFLNNLKAFQQLAENNVKLDDLVRYAQYISLKEDSFTQLLELFKGIRNPNFIFLFEEALKKLDANGKEVLAINKEQLEKLYFEKAENLPIRQAELFGLFADRFQYPELTVEIFQNHKQNKQNEYSSFLYQKAIGVLIDQSGGKHISNAVMTLMQEANSFKVPLSKVNYQINQCKAHIKEGQYQLAYNLFTQNVIEDIILAFQRERIRRFLYKYVQKIHIGTTFKLKSNMKTYFKKIKHVDHFVKSLSDKQLFDLYKEERSDNFLLECLIQQEDVFEFNKSITYREAFNQIKTEIAHGVFDYQKLLNPITESEQILREVFDNYEHYVKLEKKLLFNERKQKRVYKVMNQLRQRPGSKKTYEQTLSELEQQFKKSTIEYGLMRNDLIEFSEVEQVQQMQIKMRKQLSQLGLPVGKYKANIVTFQPLQVNSQQEQEDIEQIPNEALKKDGENPKQKGKSQKTATFKNVNKLVEEYLSKVKEDQKNLRNIDKWRRYLKTMQKGIQFKYKLQNDKNFLKRMIRKTYQCGITDQSMRELVNLKLKKKMLKPRRRQLIRNRLKEKPSKLSVFINGSVSQNDFEFMKYIYYNAYTQYDEYINVPPSNYQNEIWDLLAWGVQHQEPMAVKLGELYSNTCGAKMPEYLARLVANFYKCEVGENSSEIRQRWIKSLEIVNDISTHKVYSHTNDQAFVSLQDVEFLHVLECKQEYKGICRALLNTTHSYRKNVRYGVTQKELLV